MLPARHLTAFLLLSGGIWALASGSARARLGRSPRRLGWMGASGGVV